MYFLAKWKNEKCGEKLTPNAQFCSKCGHNMRTYNNDSKTNPLALTGFICSIVGLIVLPLILGIVSIVLGIIVKSQDNINAKSRKQSTVAIVLGVIDALWYFFWQGFLIGYFNIL